MTTFDFQQIDVFICFPSYPERGITGCIQIENEKDVSIHWNIYAGQHTVGNLLSTVQSLKSFAIFSKKVLRNFPVSDEVTNFIAKWNYLVDFLKVNSEYIFLQINPATTTNSDIAVNEGMKLSRVIPITIED